MNRRAFLQVIAAAAVAANVPVIEYAESHGIEASPADVEFLEKFAQLIREAEAAMRRNIEKDIFNSTGME